MRCCWSRYLFLAVVTALTVGQLITACGQKGPLYLPPPPAAEAEEEATDKER